MRSGLGGAGRVLMLVAITTGSVALGGLPATTAGAATAPPETTATRLAGTWGACGSWWSETPAQMESGSVCGVDGLVTDNGQATQLAEPLISVTRYVCSKGRPHRCNDESWTGAVRRSEMTVDPFLRRASIRGTLGRCMLDVEFAGLAPAQPQGGLWENHGLNGKTPTVSIGGSQTFTSQASWWGAVCGQTIVSRPESGQAWMYRGTEASISGFGEGGHGCHAAAGDRPTTAC
ncbi:MAG TPA: hypothetical protein VEG38_05150 [Acidimicrobiia bacterium]|nr:hypothetical protein [Acidimicrobiia bacterium]